ncbi:MAG: DUF2834 domain-containing protein [Cyanobacteria bacterium P01_A01_bin.68]
MYNAIPQKQFPALKYIYLLSAIIGSIVPWFFLIKFFLYDDVSVSIFFQSALSNNVASDLALDLLISGFVFFCFSFVELKRLNLSSGLLIVYIFVALIIGLSCSFPLFLYFRERELEKANQV